MFDAFCQPPCPQTLAKSLAGPGKQVSDKPQGSLLGKLSAVGKTIIHGLSQHWLSQATDWAVLLPAGH